MTTPPPAQSLKPCPFCNGEAELEEYLYPDNPPDLFSVGCTDMDCRGHPIYCVEKDGIEKEIAAWNTRPTHTRAALVEMMARAIWDAPMSNNPSKDGPEVISFEEYDELCKSIDGFNMYFSDANACLDALLPDEQVREAFEKYANARSKAQGIPVNLERWPETPHPKNGGYKDPETFAAFEGFKEGVHWQSRTPAPSVTSEMIAFEVRKILVPALATDMGIRFTSEEIAQAILTAFHVSKKEG